MLIVSAAHALLLIAVTALVTALLGMLVVYCLKGISFSRAPYGLAEGIASAVVILLHVWKRSTLLSIVSGTLCCMFLLQVVFA